MKTSGHGTTRTYRIAAAGVLLALLVGCGAAARHKVLSTFFDGVPLPKSAAAGSGDKPGPIPAASRTPAAGVVAHPPYAQKQCTACHDFAAPTSLVAEAPKLCQQCHDIKLDKPFVHDAINQGGCKGCHDPHGSKYPHLLPADGDKVCFTCHDNADVAAVVAHKGHTERCTTCHNPHESDKKHLLK